MALAVAVDPSIKADGRVTPLQIFQRAIYQRLSGSGVSFKDLVAWALGNYKSDNISLVPGIVDQNGFIHDGYRNVVLAAAVVTEVESFANVIKCENAIPAVSIMLSHLRSSVPSRARRPPNFEAELKRFCLNEPQIANKHYPIYLQGLVAETFRQVRDEAPADAVRGRCMRLISDRASNGRMGNGQEDLIWWDVSDALSEVWDPRLRQAQRDRFSPQSGYFTYIQRCEIEVGSNSIPKRTDQAKPVLPFYRTRVNVGPCWVANYLVTNEVFLEFWDHPERNRHFKATGGQWLRRHPGLMREIERSFDISARRCFWKELSEQEAVAVSGIRAEARSPLELAREKALRSEGQVALWDPMQADDRFNARGKPVVGVNWWEAMAFCDWWTKHKLPNAGFPLGSRANLLTDWEWEALRRMFYEPSDLPDQEAYEPNRYPAHTRDSTLSTTGGRVGNPMRPFHVGLALAPNGDGPTDMVGNVWEWTRSRVFGMITLSEKVNGDFGPTAWEDGDPHDERTACHPSRDRTDELNDLFYRTTRGGSFFSKDEQAAWNSGLSIV